MKTFIKYFEGIFIGYFAAMGISVLGAFIYSMPIKYFSNSESNLMYFIINFIVVSISMFVFFYFEGYRRKSYNFKIHILSVSALLVFLIIVVLIIGRAVYVSGPTDYLVRYIFIDLKSDFVVNKLIYNRHCLFFMIVSYILIYAPIMFFAFRLGNKKYQKEYARKLEDK